MAAVPDAGPTAAVSDAGPATMPPARVTLAPRAAPTSPTASGALVLTYPTPSGTPGVPGAIGGALAGGAAAPPPGLSGVAAGTGAGPAGRRESARSTQTPSCIELRAARGAVADVRVLARDRYQIGDSIGPIATVLRALSREQRTARRLDCRQRVRIATTSALPVEDFVIAINALLPHFDTELIRLTP